MSFEERQPIAEALSTVAGVNGFAYKPRAATLGDAWPQWLGGEHVAPGVFQTNWRIVVLVPVDEQAQEEWINAHLQPLVEALADVVWITDVTPGVSGDSPALMLNSRE